jgi:hypothetical protein
MTRRRSLAMLAVAAALPGCAAQQTPGAIPDAATVARTGPEALRIAVRPAARLDAAGQQLGSPLVSTPLAGPLVLLAVLDFPRAVQFVTRQTLPQLGLTEAETLARARANTIAALPPLAQVARPLPLPPATDGQGAMFRLTGDPFYESSRLADHAAWAPIARGARGQLLVLAPDYGTLLYLDSAQPNAVDALLALGAQVARQAPRPLPPAVLGWTPGGWQVVRVPGATAT